MSYREADRGPVETSGVLALAATMLRSFVALRVSGCVAGPIFGFLGAMPIYVGDPPESETPSLSGPNLAAAAEIGCTIVERVDIDVLVRQACVFGEVEPEWDPSFETRLLAQRLVQYLKVAQREQIGTWKEREDLQRELAEWLSGYVERVAPAPPIEASNAEIELAAQVERDPSNYQARLVYADSLESHGRLLEAAIARQPVRRHLRPKLDADLPSTRRVLAAASLELTEGNAGWHRATLTITPASSARSLRIQFYLDKE
jgi:hypothetical protein